MSKQVDAIGFLEDKWLVLQECFDEMDVIDLRREKKKEEELKSVSEAVAVEPATLKQINLIAEVAKGLNQAADEATMYIEGVENYLGEMGYGIEVRGDQFPGTSAVRGKTTHLEFIKTIGAHRKWCFVLVNHGGTPLQKIMPLMKVPRTSRILAARHIPALLEKMWERVVEEAKKITVEDE